MSSEHGSDGISETIEDLLRSGMLLGASLAQRHARAREQELRDAARHSLEQARAERDRQHAQRELALAGLERVNSPSWWEHASAEDIRGAWTTARTYQHEDPRAARGIWRIADEVRDRYGLDAFEIDPAAFGTRTDLEPRTLLTDDELARYDRELARYRGLLDARPDLTAEELHTRRNEIDELRGLIAEERLNAPETADQRRSRELRELGDIALIAGGGETAAVGYDTRSRRTLLADRLAALDIDSETTRAVALADVANAHPPEMAAAAAPHPAPQPRVSSQARQSLRQTRRPR